jgi:hypothetical protein
LPHIQAHRKVHLNNGLHKSKHKNSLTAFFPAIGQIRSLKQNLYAAEYQCEQKNKKKDGHIFLLSLS